MCLGFLREEIHELSSQIRAQGQGKGSKKSTPDSGGGVGMVGRGWGGGVDYVQRPLGQRGVFVFFFPQALSEVSQGRYILDEAKGIHGIRARPYMAPRPWEDTSLYPKAVEVLENFCKK